MGSRWSPDSIDWSERGTTLRSRRRGIARSLEADRRTVRASLARTGYVRTDAEARAVASVLAGREAAVVAMGERGASLGGIARLSRWLEHEAITP
jgi:hypothetical protein